MKYLYRLLTELSSRKSISKFTGTFAKSSFSRVLIPHFIKYYQIPVDEAEKELSEYESLNDFFTRRLQKGARPIDPDEQSLVSPVDARITGIGYFRSGTEMWIKGQSYTTDELLHHSPRTAIYHDGFYLVLYLSPADYHRIHAPVCGKIMEKDLVHGKVYPVHDHSLEHIKKVLSRNERLITYIAHAYGELAVVKVGALNVSSIRYTHPQLSEVRKGEELAVFEFGSTVILCMENGTFTPRPDLQEGDKVKMGESLGTLLPKQKMKMTGER